MHCAIGVVLTLFSSNAVVTAAQTPCRPPAGFKDTPHPPIAPMEHLVSHTEQIVIDRPFPVVAAVMDKPLHQVIRPSKALPGVAGEYVLTGDKFGEPGSRRIVCLTDGTTVEEESLERERTAKASRFRYVVWNYSTPKARPIEYGVGQFQITQPDGSHTRIVWTYSFKLKENAFPGYLGALGRWLFRVGFLDREYAAMMRGVLEGYKVNAEKQPANGSAEATNH